MRAAPHAGSCSSRPRHPLAVPALLALAVSLLVALGGAGGRTEPGGTEGGGCESMLNALMLLTHSAAAQAGHAGPARRDERARRIARLLVTPPAFVVRPPARPGPGSQVHVPGWSNALDSVHGTQHEVFDAEIVDGLVAAWRARRALALPASTARLIERRIHATAESSFWRWPSVRLNQINWYALMYAADAEVTRRPQALATPFRRQLARFVTGVTPARGEAGNLGPGLASTTSRIARPTRR